MSTVAVALFSALILIAAYRFYGGYLANTIFKLDDTREVPSHELEDNVDFVPTRKGIVFGHHFTSIAGTGPIVGPAIAVFWGWLPALLWVLFGGIFIGAVHDFGSLVVSLRNKGETIGQVAGRLINRRTRLLFLLILFFALTVVLGIFGLVVAQIFMIYPSSVLGTWISLPLAVVFGLLLRRTKISPALLLSIGLVLVYAAVWFGTYGGAISVDPQAWMKGTGLAGKAGWLNPVTFWTLILFAYCFAASVLPVWVLLQPRDYINSWQLILALIVLVLAVFYVGFTGQADLVSSAPAIVPVEQLPVGTPAMFPFLFITIACGAISGFHCLVASGTTSKQIDKETDAQSVGYGGMLLESGLAVMVILCCCAGIGMGKFDRVDRLDARGQLIVSFVPPSLAAASGVKDTKQTGETGSPAGVNDPAAEETQGTVGLGLDQTSATVEAVPAGSQRFAAWSQRYDSKRAWGEYKLADKIGSFIDGGASFLAVFRIPLALGQTILAVLVACFAATTLDSATRLQRYVVQELGKNLDVPPLTNKYIATALAVGLAGVIAFVPGPGGPGTGGTILWPLFGATNQLLAGLAFLVIAFYLWRRDISIAFIVLPLLLMLGIPVWALAIQLFGANGFLVPGTGKNYLLGGIGLVTIGLQVWMVVEALMLFPKVKGIREKNRRSLT